MNFNISDFVDVWSFVSFCVYIQDKLIDEIILLQVIVTESYVDINCYRFYSRLTRSLKIFFIKSGIFGKNLVAA